MTPRPTPIAVAAILMLLAALGAGPARAGSERVTVGFRMTPAEGYGPVRQDEGGMVFRSAQGPGVLTVTPQEDLYPRTIELWGRHGLTNSVVDLRPVFPGRTRKIPVGLGFGSYFLVQGSLDGVPVVGLLGGVFGPDDLLRLRVLAFAPQERWVEFRDAADAMIQSIRLEAPDQGAATLDLTPGP